MTAIYLLSIALCMLIASACFAIEWTLYRTNFGHENYETAGANGFKIAAAASVAFVVVAALLTQSVVATLHASLIATGILAAPVGLWVLYLFIARMR